jgi:uncharacterized protein (DUF2252 family)
MLQRTTAGKAETPPSDRMSPNERRNKGKALRNVAPREALAGWKAPKRRDDPVTLLEKSNDGRLPELIPIRFARMLQSPFAFFRGAAMIMAADLARMPSPGLRVQACGDAHLMNFGAFATPERNVIFDINDFDETLPAPWEWDLKRLAASVVVAARHIGLSGSEAARAARDTAQSYREHMADYASMHALDVWYDKIDIDRFLETAPARIRRQAKARIGKERAHNIPEYLFPKLAEHHGTLPRIADHPPLVFHPTPKQAPGLTSAYRKSIASYRASLPEHVRTLFDRFQFCDLAIKAVGVGSIGRACGLMLFMAADDDPLFLQVKEATQSVLEPYAGKSLHPNHGQRVVVGQRLTQSASDTFLGWVEGEAGRHFYVRQLRDLKLSVIIEDWDYELLRGYARNCAWVLAKAHARSGDAMMISGYLGSSTACDEAICEFAVDYAAQNDSDYRALVEAVRKGRVKAAVEEG